VRPLEVYERPHCACCGQLVTWQTQDKAFVGRALNFCSEQCSQVFESYLLPTQGDGLIARLERTCFVRQ